MANKIPKEKETEKKKDDNLPLFLWVRGETCFTPADLEELERQNVPHPLGLREHNEIFREFIQSLPNACLETHRKLIEAHLVDYTGAPWPFPPSGSNSRHKFYVPGKFHGLLCITWRAEMDCLETKISGSRYNHLSA